jgi:hypothetical protein
VDAVGAHDHVVLADETITQTDPSAHCAYVDEFNARPVTDRHSGCLPQQLVEIAPMHGDTGARRPPNFVETNVEQEPTSMIEHALPRDRAATALHEFVKPKHPERSNTIGRKKEAGADMILFDRALHDLGGKLSLP